MCSERRKNLNTINKILTIIKLNFYYLRRMSEKILQYFEVFLFFCFNFKIKITVIYVCILFFKVQFLLMPTVNIFILYADIDLNSIIQDKQNENLLFIFIINNEKYSCIH